jgi:adenylate kinase family enzyme
VYQQQTSPIIEYYEQHGADVHFIDGDRDIEQVQRDILQIVDR